MATIIDNIALDETNVEFNYASDFVKHTDRLVYLTGKAGTGKTTFLKYLRETTTKNTVILAPTGVAAINAGGQTINSFFKIPFGPFVPNDKRLRKRPEEGEIDRSTIYSHFQYNNEKLEIIRGMELLIIDEISMVRCDLLDVIDRLLRVFRKRENAVFGGVQVILIGDTFQLPPIDKEWNILQPFYDSIFFFSSKVILNNKPVYIELKKIYRQNEQEFIDLLNRIRVNQVSSNELNLLNSKYNPTFSPNRHSNYITLATHNYLVDNTNLKNLAELPTELKMFEANISGLFPDNIMPTDRVLQLKEGSQIMFIKNDKTKRYYNGKIAKISKIEDNKIVVEFSEDNEITIEKQEWNNIKYTWNEKEKKIEEEIIGTFRQFPVKLAWAITVHKSQGLTFEKVVADLGSAFASGQVYVALSRCKSFNGLVLKTKVDNAAIKTDPKVIKFAENETPSTLILQELNSGKADFYYNKVRESVKSLDFVAAYNNFTKALEFRNDIETDTFKNYFINTTSRFKSAIRLLIHVLRKLEIAKHKIKEYEILIDSERNNHSKIVNELNIQIIWNDATNAANNQHYTLLIEEKKIELEKQKSENNKLKIEKLKAEKSIQKSQKTIQEQIELISKLEMKVRHNEQEIDRLRNLKWHQKLFGQK
jgi:hypothetical protein